MGGRGSGGGPATGRRPAVVVLDDGPLVDVHPPDDLTPGQRAVWDADAPLAIRLRTLTPESRGAFVELCRVTALAERVSRELESADLIAETVSVDGAGVEHREFKKHPLMAEFRGFTQQLRAWRALFGLAPNGRPMTTAAPKEKPKSALEALQARRASIHAVK